MSWGADLIAMIDQRIRLAFKADKASGTVVARDSSGYEAQVLFDGSTTAVPVKCVGNVFCRDGDRVVLNRYGSDWVIVGAFVGAGLGEARRRWDGLPSTTAPMTSGAWVDLTEFGTFGFTKAYDSTYVRCGMLWSGRGTATNTRVAFGVRLTATEGGEGYTPIDYTVGTALIYAANARVLAYSATRLTGGPGGLPAGTYTATYRWRRAAGTGDVISDTFDPMLMEFDEGFRETSPGL